MSNDLSEATGTEIAVDAPRVGGVPDVAQLLQLAIKSGMAPEQLEKLVALQERILDRQAEIAFNAALAAFQASAPIITKNKVQTVHGKKGTYETKFADLPHIMRTIRPLMTKHGFADSYTSKFEDGYVEVTCILSHRDGHSRDTNFTAPTDPRAVMSDTQKAGSARTFGRRYALLDALGILTDEIDDDGYAAGSRKIGADQAEEIRKLLAESGKDERKLLNYVFGVERAATARIEDIPATSYELAMNALDPKRRVGP